MLDRLKNHLQELREQQETIDIDHVLELIETYKAELSMQDGIDIIKESLKNEKVD